MCYFIGWSLFLLFFKLYLGFKIVGRENVPKKNAFIFVSNHVSYFDPILLGTSVHRSLNYMARDTLFKRPCFGWVMGQVHAFPVKRNDSDFRAIKEAIRILSSGKPLVIFPEGTRAKDRSLKSGKPGVGFIVSKLRVPVVPAYIDGSFDALPRSLKTLQRHPVTAYIGKPIIFDLSNFDRKDRDSYQKITDAIMAEIAKLRDTYVGKAG